MPQNTLNQATSLGDTIPTFSPFPFEISAAAATAVKKRHPDYQQSSEAKRRFSLPTLGLTSHVQAHRNTDSSIFLERAQDLVCFAKNPDRVEKCVSESDE
ncbi:hypothetical protein BGZ76_000738 [Entomortierella beljakovae]|nr:hypothetical protein BGZ76_000738 [Entomortierella beljakovae]